MRVKISETCEMSDKQRVELARLLDGPDARKRNATREEARTFIWKHGADWARALVSATRYEEDLIGSVDPDQMLLDELI